MIENSDKFQCKSCGNCCRKFRGRLSETGSSETGSKDKLPPIFYEFTPHENATIPIYDFELPVLKKKAHDLKTELKIKPFLVIWDDISETSLVMTWTLDHEDCPFLSQDNLCKINNEKPLVCQAYPLFVTSLINPQREKVIKINYGDCKNAFIFKEPKNNETITYNTAFKMIFNAYGNCLAGALQMGAATKLIVETINSLSKEWKISPAIIEPEVIKLLSRNSNIGFFDFIKKKYPNKYKTLTRKVKALYEVDFNYIEQTINPAK